MKALPILLKTSFFLSFCLLLGSCATITKTGFDQHKNLVGVNLQNHNLGYQFSANQLFNEPYSKQIDKFDKLFFDELEYEISDEGYAYNQNGGMQTLSLENCVIDFSLTESKRRIYKEDTLNFSQLNVTFVCNQIPANPKLFYSSIKQDLSYKVIPIEQFNLSSDTAKYDWQFSKHYAYHPEPISQDQSNKLANELAHRVKEKVDSCEKAMFKKNYPEIAAQTYTKTGDQIFFSGFKKAVFIVAIVSLYILIVN